MLIDFIAVIYFILLLYIDPPEIKDLDIVGSGMERSEGEMISFKCVIDSYPNSDVTWISKTGNSRAIYIDYKKEISYFNITTTCLDTGLYQCSASNKIGTAAINQTRLFVKCKYFISIVSNNDGQTNLMMKQHIYFIKIQ